MTFKNIIITCQKTYNVSDKEIAEHSCATVEEVESWKQGIALPTHHQLEHFSALFAIPLTTLEKATIEEK